MAVASTPRMPIRLPASLVKSISSSVWKTSPLRFESAGSNDGSAGQRKPPEPSRPFAITSLRAWTDSPVESVARKKSLAGSTLSRATLFSTFKPTVSRTQSR